ncbi:MAG: hypothetical protein HOO13_00075 [Nitrosomonadales bacterium]|jgi:cell shape-determining protein MreD|nr:hypothetical protein [Nitrosomonadales bacterium]
MVNKSYNVMARQGKLFVGLFLFSTLFSFIDLSNLIGIYFNPDYFLALMILTISSNLIPLNIPKIFLMGILVDILIGSILGQYTLTFLTLFGLQAFLKNYFSIPSQIQAIFFKFILISLGVIILSILSQKFNSYSYLFDIGITFFVFIIFQLLYEKTYGQ